MHDHDYLLLPTRDLFKEVDVDSVKLRQVCLALKRQEVVDIFLRLHLLDEIVHVDLLESLLWLVLLHRVAILNVELCFIKFLNIDYTSSPFIHL